VFAVALSVCILLTFAVTCHRKWFGPRKSKLWKWILNMMMIY